MGRKPEKKERPLEDINKVIHSPARLRILTYLYVVESADYVFLLHQTGLTWGNLATHLNKLDEVNYIEVEKTFKNKKPHTMLRITEQGRKAVRDYKQTMQRVLDDLPD